jgi:hypothetical protein
MRRVRRSEVTRERVVSHQIEAARRRARRYIIDINLSEIRKVAGKTPDEIAEAIQAVHGTGPSNDRADEHLISVLRRYVEALGGELRIIADFGETQIRVKGV